MLQGIKCCPCQVMPLNLLLCLPFRSTCSNNAQQQLRHLDRVITGLKRIPKSAKTGQDGTKTKDLKALLDRAVPLVLNAETDSKVNRKLHRVSILPIRLKN